jgi:putative ABC transport system substrate-binding protein
MSPTRRSLAIGLLTAMTGPWPAARAAEVASPRRVGVLAPSTRAREEVTLQPFYDEMIRLGWVEGRHVVYDRVYGLDQQAELPQLAAALVARGPEIIYAPPPPAAAAARGATRHIPIVFATAVDPVGAGLVQSLAQPGGNVTGIASSTESLAPKRLELVRELMPRARRLGLISDATDARAKADLSALAPRVAAAGLVLVVAEASNPQDFDAAVRQLLDQKVDAVLQVSTLSFNMRGPLLELAAARKVPVIGSRAVFADAGALFSYGADFSAQIRRSAHYVDKILRGARPADLPVEQPSRLELVINLRTARLLGLTIPQAAVLRADRVIE